MRRLYFVVSFLLLSSNGCGSAGGDTTGTGGAVGNGGATGGVVGATGGIGGAGGESGGGAGIGGKGTGGAGGTSGAAGSNGPDGGALPLDGGGSIQALPLSTNDLVFDSTRGVLYATNNGTPDAGNSVLTIDPASAKVTATLPIGGLPTVLAISDDGSALYVGVSTPGGSFSPTPQIDGANTVCRIDLASTTAGPLVSLGSTNITAGQIAAVPGSSTQFMVSLRQPEVTPEFAGLALYDSSTLLAHWNYPYTTDNITFSGPSTLFGCSSTTEPSELVQFSVTAAAITPRMTVSGLITNGGARITANGGWIFASDGQTVSAVTMASVGTYNDTAAKAPLISVVPAADGTNVWFLGEPNMGGPTLLQFDRTTFQLLRTISLAPGYIEGNLYGLTGLVQWSPTGFAFRSYSNIFLVTVPN
jgi:hypothetical protein